MNIGISESDRDFAKYEKLKDNFDWFYSNYEELKRDYNDQYVAIKDKKQIDNDFNLDLLLQRLNLYNCDESIAIEYVCKQLTYMINMSRKCRLTKFVCKVKNTL